MLAIGWIFFFILAYKVSLIQLDYVEYDPYVELELDRVCYLFLLLYYVIHMLNWSLTGYVICFCCCSIMLSIC